jgi:hypothetical protein
MSNLNPMTTVCIYSEAFCDRELKDIWTVRPTSDLFETWMREHPTSTRLFVRIHHPFQLDEPMLAAVGDPIETPEFHNAVFLPMWMIQSNQYSGVGEETRISVFDQSELPKATRIVVRPVDSLLFQTSDVLSIFERNLSKLGVLQQGKLYPLPLEEFDGEIVTFFTEVLEPEGEVFLDGDDIPLEFEEAVDSPPPATFVRIPTPPPEPIPRFLEQGAAMIPDFLPGNSVVEAPMRPRNSFAPTSFTPFSGKGRRLNE